MKEKILISTGGSGGHVIPALNFYDHLKNDYEVYLITDLRGSKFINSEVYKNYIIDKLDIIYCIYSQIINFLKKK